uniref:F-box domain-containing protein n=1 Tax=Culex tarsalis TaxID=7177 RepID=A0A1Q3EWY0_CULTA
MTGATTEESPLHLFRSSSASSSSSSSTNQPTTSTASSAVTSRSSGLATSTHSSSYGGTASPAVLGGMAMAVLNPPPPQQQPPPQPPPPELNLLDMPVEILGHIFSYVGYKKVAQMRVISHQMNQVCSSILNSTFQKLQTQMLNRFQIVKAKMPRRESARRNHPLACECDILETCSMRLSLLQMTFGKHIERKHCCFFPGGILDEVYSVINYIRSTPALARPFKVTDELFDLSTMAMEYFREHIEPNLPDITYFNKDYTSSTKPFKTLEVSSSILSRDTSHSSSSSPPQSNMVLRKGIRKIKQGMKRYNNQLSVLRSELRTCKRKATEQAKQIGEQQKLLAEQQKQTLDYANRLDENDKKNEEISRKFSTLLQELNKCKTELQYWRSKSPATPNCNACGQAIVAMLPEDLQALVNQGVRPEEVGLAAIPEEPAVLEADEGNGMALDLDAQPMSPLPAPVVVAVTGSPRSQKRKFESVESASDELVAGSSAASSEPGSGSASPLNPPFASAPLASLVASYSSFSAGPSSSSGSSSICPSPPSSSSSSSSAVLSLLVPTCSSPSHASPLASPSAGPSSAGATAPQLDVPSGGASSSDSVNYKKLRRVQTKARSQTNHNNTSTVANTNTKATRSKHVEK